MGRYSKRSSSKRSSSRRSSGRERMRYERSIDSGSASKKRKRLNAEGGSPASRITREAKNAKISNTRLAAAKKLDKVPATLLAERDRRKRRTRKRILIASAALATILFAIIAAGALYYLNLRSRMVVSDDVPASVRNSPAPGFEDPYNIVIFGSDARTAESPGRTDTIILARVVPSTREVWMVSIPRDTRIEIPGRGAHKINAAYAFGGPEGGISAVEQISGQSVDHFMTIDFTGFEEIVDAIGGIEIDVPIDIDDPRADFTRPRRASRIAAGPQILDGAHALTFVRHRSGYQDGDIGRTQAQQLFFQAVIKQMGDVPVARVPGLIDSVADNVGTNLTPLQLLTVARSMRGVSPSNFHSITLPGEWRSPFIWTDEEEAAVIWRNFGTAPFDAEEEAEEELSITPAEVNVAVRNGTTRVGIAAEAAAILRARGFIVDEVGNTDNQSVYEENMIVYQENRQAAELIARFMPEGTRIVQGRGMFRFDTETLVILGTEWDVREVPVADVTVE